jgi:hybrid polyketide synthase/nonribosomal peptide synthetase ACE1
LKDGLGNNLTYGQMAGRVQAIAASLIAAGAGDGAAVGVFQTPSADWICSLLAVLRVGATYVPLDLRSSMDRLATIAELAKPAFLLTDASTSAQTAGLNLSDAVDIVVSDLAGSEADADPVPNQAKAEATAIMLFTSGTSGQPKGVLLTHENLRAQVEGYSRSYDVPSLSSVVLQQTIYSFDMSLDQIFAALAHGGCLVIVPADKRGDPESITTLMAEHGVTYTLATPSEYNAWFTYARENLSRCQAWQAAFAGGEHLHRGVIDQFADLAREQVLSVRLFNAYGPTEVTVAVTRGEVKHNNPELEYPVPVGSVLPNYRVAVVDERVHAAPVGVVGEVCVGGPGVARGYLASPGVTQDSFIPGANIHPSLAETGTWYRTGDLGVLRENGAVHIVGRIAGDNQVKLRGFRVEPQEVEAVLLNTADGALSDAVVTIRGEDDGRFLAAHVMFAPDVPEDRRPGIVRRLQSGLPLPSYMQPAVIVPIDTIPLTIRGKFDRAAIQALPLPDKPDPAPGAADLTDEGKLAALWRRVIPHGIPAELTPETGFFEAGGTSLLLVKLQALIKAELNSSPSLADLVMNSGTLGGMAKVVESRVTPPLDWEAETSVSDLVARPSSSTDDAGVADAETSPIKIILSGATGYLGRHLLARLVADPRIGVVTCLVRDVDAASSAHEAFASPKVQLIQADLSQPTPNNNNTQLSDALAKDASAIVHCAANRSFFDNYASLRAINVSSVKQLAQLALSANNAPLHFVSSGATAKYEGTAPPTDGSDGYVASKWAAEQVLRNAAAAHGLRAYLHRPLPLPLPAVTVVADGAEKEGEQEETSATAALLDELVSITGRIGARPDLSVISGNVDVTPVEKVVEDMAVSIFTSCDVAVASEEGESEVVQVVKHEAQHRLPVEELARVVEGDEELRALPTMDTLVWFGEAKKVGFSQFMTAQGFVIGSGEVELAARR